MYTFRKLPILLLASLMAWLGTTDAAAQPPQMERPRHSFSIQPMLGFGVSSLEGNIWTIGLGAGHAWHALSHMSIASSLYASRTSSSLRRNIDMGAETGPRFHLSASHIGPFVGLSQGIRRTRYVSDTFEYTDLLSVTCPYIGYRLLMGRNVHLTGWIGPAYIIPLSSDDPSFWSPLGGISAGISF